MKISAISFRGYDPYPVNGGKVEKLQYEVEHGMREPSDNQAVRDYIDRERANRDFEQWSHNWFLATGGDDGDDWMDDDF